VVVGGKTPETVLLSAKAVQAVKIDLIGWLLWLVELEIKLASYSELDYC